MTTPGLAEERRELEAWLRGLRGTPEQRAEAVSAAVLVGQRTVGQALLAWTWVAGGSEQTTARELQVRGQVFWAGFWLARGDDGYAAELARVRADWEQDRMRAARERAEGLLRTMVPLAALESQ